VGVSTTGAGRSLAGGAAFASAAEAVGVSVVKLNSTIRDFAIMVFTSR
jgi:hypothetical protein